MNLRPERTPLASAADQRENLDLVGLHQHPQLLSQLSPSELAGLMVTLPSDLAPQGSKFGDDVWVWPSRFHDADPLSTRSVKFAAEEFCPEAIDEVKRLLVACLAFPLRRQCGLPTIQSKWSHLKGLMAALRDAGHHGSLAAVTQTQLNAAFASTYADRAPASVERMHSTLGEIQKYSKLGRIKAFFAELDLRLPTLLGPLQERPEVDLDATRGKWQPLSDEFVNTATPIWLLYLESIAPNLETLFQKRKSISTAGEVLTLRAQNPKKDTLRHREAKIWAGILRNHTWVDASGRQIHHLPPNAGIPFPPKNQYQLNYIFSICQSALLQILLLMTGGRASEIVTLKQNSLVAVKGETTLLRGKTFKLSGVSQGEPIDWPLPSRVVRFVEQQIRLAELTLIDKSKSLWVSTNYATHKQGRINAQYRVVRFAQLHRFDDHLDSNRYHPHRFRKTVARLVVLSLTGSPVILQTIFGHSDLQTTINYMVSNPAIRDEMREIAIAQMEALSEEVLASLDDAAGNGAKHLRSMKDKFFDRLKVPSDERHQRVRQDEFVGAHLLGGAVEMKLIFPGIVCLRASAGTGLCGQREIVVSNCQPNCTNFLILPSQKDQVYHTIDLLLNEVRNPNIIEQPLLFRWYSAQLLDYLSFFKDVTAKFAADDRLNAFQNELELDQSS
jgi:integrase